MNLWVRTRVSLGDVLTFRVSSHATSFHDVRPHAGWPKIAPFPEESMTSPVPRVTPRDPFQARFDRHDWGSTPIGGRCSWPPALHFAVELMLGSRQAMIVTWGERHTLLFNEAFAVILGEKCWDALGTLLPETWADAWPLFGHIFEEAFEGKGPVAEDQLFPTWASGFEEFRYFSFSSMAIRDSGAIGGVLWLCTDVTERMVAREQALQERDALLVAFEQAPGFIAMSDGREHCFTFANAAFRRLVGTRDLIGRTVAEALPRAIRQGFIGQLDSVFATGEPFTGHTTPIELDTSDGGTKIRYADFVCAPRFGADGEVVGIFCEGQDVTERVQSTTRIRALQNELIHTSRGDAMNIMASTLAHELNQPLTAITNFASAAKQLMTLGSIDEVRTCHEGLIANALRAGDIIRGARNMLEQRPCSSISFCLNDAIEEAYDQFSEHCEVSFDLERNLIVAGHKVQIQQVILNLMRNACEAAGGGSTPAVEVKARSNGSTVVTSVSDNGPGIAATPIESIFRTFSSTKVDGMGIGLAISETIVEAHGGRIWAENVAGGGASVHFELATPDGNEQE